MVFPLFWLSIACRTETEPAGLPDATAGVGLTCDPLHPEACALPWPSTAYMTEDSQTVTGWRVALETTTLPANTNGTPLNPDAWNEKDGFSTWGPLVFFLDGVTPGDLPSPRNPLEKDTLLLLDAQTGERVPVWGELDLYTEAGEPRAITIRLAQPMAHGRRYIAVVQKLHDADGVEIPPVPGFSALLRGEGRRSGYYAERIFPTLRAAGVDLQGVQLAWDLVTVSAESSLERARWIAEDVASWAPEYAIDDVSDRDCAIDPRGTWRRITGTFTAPLYTTEDAPGAMLTRDDAGMPYRNGETRVDFLATIPCTRFAQGAPGPIIQYGHGFFGGRDEIGGDAVLLAQDRLGWTVIAADWAGMSTPDLLTTFSIIETDLSRFNALPERVIQGYAQFDVLLRLARTRLPDDPAFHLDNTPLIDGEQFGFYGISQGGVLGMGYLGFSETLERGALSVPGGPFTTLMPRSFLFQPFFNAFSTAYPDPLERAVVLGSLQTVWDPGEGAGWAQTMTDDVLIQTGSGDAQVSPLGARNLARAIGAATVKPPRPAWGLEQRDPGFSGSAFVEWFYEDSPDEPLEGLPPSLRTDTHACVRLEPEAQDQVHDFITSGVLNHYCDGPCITTRCE